MADPAVGGSATQDYRGEPPSGTPLALGSYWGLVPIAAMMPFLIWRLLDEERLLARDLAGYTEYQKRVRHRLVPFVW